MRTCCDASAGVQDGSTASGNSAEDSPSPASAAKNGGKVRVPQQLHCGDSASLSHWVSRDSQAGAIGMTVLEPWWCQSQRLCNPSPHRPALCQPRESSKVASLPDDTAAGQGRRCSLGSASSGTSSWSRPSSSRYSAGGRTPSRGQRGFGGPRRDCELCELHDAAGRLCKKARPAASGL